jgi:hypothetical protein
MNTRYRLCFLVVALLCGLSLHCGGAFGRVEAYAYAPAASPAAIIVRFSA